MKRSVILLTFFLIGIGLLISGCIMVDRHFRQTRNEIFDSLNDCTIRKDLEFKIGHGLLIPVKMTSGFLHIDPEAREILNKIFHVQVGIYQLENRNDLSHPFPKSLEKRLLALGFQPIIKARSKEDNVWVFVKSRGQRLRGMYIISLDDEELALVEIEGKLGELIEDAVREHGFVKERKTLLAKSNK